MKPRNALKTDLFADEHHRQKSQAGAKALFDGVSAQLLKKGFIARGGQIIDASVEKPSRVRARALLYGRIGWKYRVLRGARSFMGHLCLQ
jgi:hypothetical protein